MKFKYVLVFVIIIAEINCAKILVYIPVPSISHQVPFRGLTQELAKRGHEVVVLTTDLAFTKEKRPANLTEVDLHNISYEKFKEALKSVSRGKKSDVVNFLRVMLDAITKIIDLQLSEAKEIINGPKYDLLLLQAFTPEPLALSYIHKVPVIQMSSLGNIFNTADIIGAPTHPILYPSSTRHRLYNLTFSEKFKELYNHFAIKKMLSDQEYVAEQMLRTHFGKDMPPLSDLKNNVDMLFLNMHPIFEGNFPVPPSVVYMWGIHQKPEKALPQDLKTFLDSSKHGVIYMSFGTNTDPTLLPPEIIQIFVKVFCQLPYDVLWKWNNDELPGRCSNIRIGKWFPQSDLLRHPKIKVFVTQGGLQSTDEAITAGVPLVGIPMMGDQWYNVEKYVKFKIGVQLDLETINKEHFKEAVTNVIHDESYRRNIRKLDELMRDEPVPALERAVWWVEHVLRHGGARHLRSPAANISWAQYLELELVVILLSIFFTSLMVFIFILNRIINLFKSSLETSSKIKTH